MEVIAGCYHLGVLSTPQKGVGLATLIPDQGEGIMEIQELLNKCRMALGAETDYQLAKKSGISEARLSDYRTGKRYPNAKDCFIIADILELDARCLIAHFEELGAKSQETKEFWKKKLAELGGVAASIIFGVNLIMTPSPAEAAPILGSAGVNTVYYVKCRRLLERIKQAALALVEIKSLPRLTVCGIG